MPEKTDIIAGKVKTLKQSLDNLRSLLNTVERTIDAIDANILDLKKELTQSE